MARVTVEDCLEKIDNRFDLVMVAAKRAHQISAGTHSSLLDTGKDKPAIIALREIAEGLIDRSILSNSAHTSFGVTDMAEVEAEFSEVAIDNKVDQLSEVTGS